MAVKQMLHGCAALMLLSMPATAADPIKIGFSSPETGGSAASGKQFVMAAQIWAEHVNSQGRPAGPQGRARSTTTTRAIPALVPGDLHEAARRRQGRPRGRVGRPITAPPRCRS